MHSGERQHINPVVDQEGERPVKRILAIGVIAVIVALGFPSAAFAQSGHFLTGGGNAATCTDIGTQVTCSGKVAGLGGTTFEITIEADGIASVECTNPGGNVAPGQDTAVTVEGSTDPQPTPRNGQSRFTVTTDDPEPLRRHPRAPTTSGRRTSSTSPSRPRRSACSRTMC